MAHFVYIMASRPFGSLYTGRTANPRQRVEAHRSGLSQHTDRYNIKRLVWFEAHEDFDTSLQREHSLKRWRRDWKLKLITDANPEWRDTTHLLPD